MTREDISSVYREVRRIIGTEHNGAFIPEAVSTLLAQQFAEQFGWDISPDYFVKAFWLQEVPLYADADTFLKKIGADPSIVSLIYTQGQVFDRGMPGDAGNHGFQNHKVEVAGIPWYFGKSNRAILKENGLEFVHGHFYKTDPDCLHPVLEFVKKYNLPIHYFDDLAKNHEEVGAFFSKNGVTCNLYWLNRDRKEPNHFTTPVQEIACFDEVDIHKLQDSLVMLDLDGTLIDNIAMRRHLHDQVMLYAQKLQDEM